MKLNKKWDVSGKFFVSVQTILNFQLTVKEIANIDLPIQFRRDKCHLRDHRRPHSSVSRLHIYKNRVILYKNRTELMKCLLTRKYKFL